MITEKNLQNYSGYVSIHKGDWDYPHTMTDMANRIVADWRFDAYCQKRRLSNYRYSKRKGEVI